MKQIFSLLFHPKGKIKLNIVPTLNKIPDTLNLFFSTVEVKIKICTRMLHITNYLPLAYMLASFK